MFDGISVRYVFPTNDNEDGICRTHTAHNGHWKAAYQIFGFLRHSKIVTTQGVLVRVKILWSQITLNYGLKRSISCAVLCVD